MDDIRIIAAYCIIEDALCALGHKSHYHAQVSDAEVLWLAVVSSMYFQNHHERTLFVVKGLHYISKPISTSRFSRRLHELAVWLEQLVHLLGEIFATGEVFVIDSLPVPVCKRVRAFRCRKVDGHACRGYFGYCAAKKWAFYGWRLHLICTPQGIPVSFQMLPGGWHDLSAIHELTFVLPPGARLYGDKAYISKQVEPFLMEEGEIELIPVRKANMKIQNTFSEWVGLRDNRPAIESANAQLEKMGIQRLHARTNQGFSIKVLSSLFALLCFNI